MFWCLAEGLARSLLKAQVCPFLGVMNMGDDLAAPLNQGPNPRPMYYHPPQGHPEQHQYVPMPEYSPYQQDPHQQRNPILGYLPYFGRNAVEEHLNCHYCGFSGNCVVEKQCNTVQWLLCLLMCIFGFWMCSILPFCVDSCYRSIMVCPSCGETTARDREFTGV